jgi:hypothetical protein
MTDTKSKTLKVQIKGIDLGDGAVKYATSGLHVAPEHRSLLPQATKKNALGDERKEMGNKMIPGVVYDLPADIAKAYLKSSARCLEQVYE